MQSTEPFDFEMSADLHADITSVLQDGETVEGFVLTTLRNAVARRPQDAGPEAPGSAPNRDLPPGD